MKNYIKIESGDDNISTTTTFLFPNNDYFRDINFIVTEAIKKLSYNASAIERTEVQHTQIKSPPPE